MHKIYEVRHSISDRHDTLTAMVSGEDQARWLADQPLGWFGSKGSWKEREVLDLGSDPQQGWEAHNKKGDQS